jgi:hypothetical protein
MSPPEIELRVRDYAAVHGLTIDFALPLGFGQDGQVFRTSRKTAVKAFERFQNFAAERECYQRLSDAEVTSIGGLNVPDLVFYDNRRMIVEMSIVKPPYLLDFGKAHLDVRPEFPAETLQEWEESLVDYFGEDVPQIKRVLRELTKYGIYYYDAKPANIRLRP